MRLTRAHLYLLGGFLLVLLSPVVLSQPDPNGGRGGKGKRPKMDPNAFWEQISQGRDSINVNEVQFPPEMERMAGFFQQRWSEFLQQKGVTNGIMTKALYLEQSEQARQARAAGGFGGKGGGGKGGGGYGKGGPPDGKGAATTDPKEEDAKIEEEARKWFTSLDVNKDEVIDRDEARRAPILRDFDRYDADGDGKISVDEFLEAYRDDQGRRGRGSRAVIIQGTAPPAEEDRRPVVYRAGKLPKELPPWFAQFDRDKDGQVGLYEWNAAGRPIKEFLAMDANRDGFLTAEEVLRFQKAQRKNAPAKDGRFGPGGAGIRGMGPSSAGIPGMDPLSAGIPGAQDSGDGTPTAENSATSGNPTGGRTRGGAGGGNNRRTRRPPAGG